MKWALEKENNANLVCVVFCVKLWVIFANYQVFLCCEPSPKNPCQRNKTVKKILRKFLSDLNRSEPFNWINEFASKTTDVLLQKFKNQLVLNRFPIDTGRKLNVHKTFRRRPGRLLNVLCTLNLRPVSTGFVINFNWLTLDKNLFYSNLIITAKFESRNWRQN